MSSLRVVVAVLVCAAFGASAEKQHLFRKVNVSDPDPVCDCSCYGDSATSARFNCQCTSLGWHSCFYGFGNPPKAMGPAMKETEAACCAYDWQFLKDKKATRLMDTIAVPRANVKVAQIDMTLNFVLRWTMALQSMRSGSVFYFSNGSFVIEPSLDVTQDGKLTLTFGDDQNPTRSVTSTRAMALGKFYDFELTVQDCPVPSCVSLRDSSGNAWLSLTAPMEYRVALPNTWVYVSKPSAAAANVRVQNLFYNELPFNAHVLTGFPLNLRSTLDGALAVFPGVLNYRVTFDITLISSGVGNVFKFKAGSTEVVSVGVANTTRLFLSVANTDNTSSSGTTPNPLTVGTKYQFEIIVSDTLVELVETKPQQALPSMRLSWLSFASLKTKRLKATDGAFLCTGSTCANANIGNFLHFKIE